MTSEELLKQHYNQANALYQAGNLFQAHQELQAALEYATTDQQRESIRDNMKRIEALLEQARIQVPQSAVSEEAVHPEAPAEAEPRFWQNKNKLGVLLLLVALICLLPITIKCIEIFTPRKPVTEASPSPAASVAPTASLPASEMQAEGAVASAEPAAAAAEVRVTANGVNLREQPSRQAPRVASLTLNQAVQLLEDKTQAADGLTWSKIQTAEGQVGWISAAYLSVTEAAAPASAAPASAAPTVASTANPAVAASAEPAESATLAPETPATAPASAPLSGTSARVSAEGVSLRSGPSVSQALLLTLPAGAVLELLPGTSVSADNLEWVQVKTQNGKTGWMARKFLAP